MTQGRRSFPSSGRSRRRWRERTIKGPFLLIAAPVLFAMIAVIIGAGGIFAQSQITITGLEINQVLGVQKDDNKYFVAGKNTVVRAFLDSAVAIDLDREKTHIKVSRDGKEVFKIYAKKSVAPVSTIDFLCTNMTACQNWVAGSYTFEPRINGTAGSAVGPYVFDTGSAIRVLAVTVKANYGTGGTKTVSGEQWKKLGEFMQAVYPLAEGNLVWEIRQTELDASADAYNLEKSDWSGCKNLSNALAGLIPVKCRTSPGEKGCYDFVVGFIKEGLTQDNGDDLAGFAYVGSKAVVAVAGDDDAPGTVAHEIAHQYGIGDTYDDEKLSSIRCSVNPAPDGFKGRDWDDFERVVSCANGRTASTLKGKDGKTVINGAQIKTEDHPYEVNGRGPLSEMADFMSAGGAWQKQMWITQDTYDWLYRRLVKKDAELIKVFPVVTTSEITKRFVSFSGTLFKNGAVALNPWKSYRDSATLVDSKGPLMVRAVGTNGSVLASTSFTVHFFTVHPPRALTEAPFEGVIHFPAGTAKFQVIKDGIVLVEVPVSDHEPVVTDVTPRSTATISGIYTITWKGNDPDADALTYTVEYNPDVTSAAVGWMILADELESSSWTQDFNELPGGNHAKIRVTANDGTLYGEAESAEFIVPLKKPEIYLDDELPWGMQYDPGEDILLTADAYDLQDGPLPDEKIRWTSSISGELGHGAVLIVEDLASGLHTITVTATNSAGLSSSETIRVSVGKGTGSVKCFIATAAFGSYLHPYVGYLRDFRDAYLLSSAAGRAFVRWYYRVSPPLADWIAHRDAARTMVRIALLPAVGFSALALQVGLSGSSFFFLAFVVLACAGTRKLIRTGRGRS